MKFDQAYSNYNNTSSHWRPNWEKIKELRKKLNFPIHSKNHRLGLISPFLGQNIIFKISGSVCSTLHEHLTSCWLPEKTKEPISIKLPNRKTEGPYSYDPSGHGQGSYKRISQLRDIAVDNKNKIQYKSA